MELRFCPETTPISPGVSGCIVHDGTRRSSGAFAESCSGPFQSYRFMPSSRFKVRVTKDYLVFCSGHFITYDGDHCERIHGHNYRAAVEVEGDLDQNHYVIDFIALKDMTRAITDELDHRMLLPSRSRQILLHEDGPNMRVTYRDRYWSFPREECVLVPIANTTAELLADYIAGRLRQAMTARGFEAPADPARRSRGELRPIGDSRMAAG